MRNILVGHGGSVFQTISQVVHDSLVMADVLLGDADLFMYRLVGKPFQPSLDEMDFALHAKDIRVAQLLGHGSLANKFVAFALFLA